MTGNMLEEHALRIVKDVEKFAAERSVALLKSFIGAIRPVFLPLDKVCAVE